MQNDNPQTTKANMKERKVIREFLTEIMPKLSREEQIMIVTINTRLLAKDVL